MNVERHRRALQLCDEAMDLPAAEQSALLRNVAGSDAELLALATELLARMARPDDKLATGGAAVNYVAIAPGEQLAGYRVERLLGEGGMGAVYLASREDGGVTRQVALKTMNRLQPQPLELARFVAEQRALAELHHPYIAALVDVGVAANGTPFFAMEYVPGADIDRHCNAKQLTLHDRIALWLKVCDAAQYAHRNLVVHRDIKPANVLVSDDGLPKLLDFGVAKLLSAGSNELTAEFARHLTIDYATPERILRSAVSTAEDVYALGALLYELIVGLRAFDRGRLTFAELARQLEVERAPAPVAKFDSLDSAQRQQIAQQRNTSVRQLRTELQSDLSAVLDRALHPDVAQRYASVEQLAEDVRRWQRGLPVSARGDSVWYRARRFVGRHKLALAAAGLSASALLLALGVSVVQTRAATEQARRATAVSGFLQELLAAPSARWDTHWHGRADISMAQVLDLAAAQLNTQLHDQPQVRVELYSSLARAYVAVGRQKEALAVQRKAQAIVEQSVPIDSPLQASTSTALATMLDYQRTPQTLREARTYLERSIAWLNKYRPDAYFEHGATLGEVGLNLLYSGELTPAVAAFKHAIAVGIQSGAPPDHPLFALGYGLLGITYFDLHDLQNARTHLEHAERITRQNIAAPTSDVIDALGPLAFIDVVEGRYTDAIAAQQLALDVARVTTGARSPETAEVLMGVARVNICAGKVAAARAAFDEAHDIANTQNNLEPYARTALALVHAELALAEGDNALAVTLLQPLGALRSTTRLRSISIDVRGRWLAASGRALLRTGHADRALPLLTEAQAHWLKLFGAKATLVSGLQADFAAARSTAPQSNEVDASHANN